jgi:hypothetical protein
MKYMISGCWKIFFFGDQFDFLNRLLLFFTKNYEYRKIEIESKNGWEATKVS